MELDHLDQEEHQEKGEHLDLMANLDHKEIEVNQDHQDHLVVQVKLADLVNVVNQDYQVLLDNQDQVDLQVLEENLVHQGLADLEGK